ncbi:MAG TPA: response regulator [Tepidisphaeraceae bacterium]|nr:response regulator [Tepidisphaeraceae bacterium]
MNPTTIVHIVDDDPGVRKSLQMVLESASLAVKVYESAERFLEDMDLSISGCIVLDLRMPGIDGIELLQRLRTAGHEIPVIVISAHADVPTAVRSMKLGAVDLLQKPFEPKALLEIVRRAVQKSVEINQKRAEENAIRKRLADLTTRELELLRLVVAGRSNKQIASDLNISIKTVANHRANLMAKTHALNAADLTRISTIAGIRPQ